MLILTWGGIIFVDILQHAILELRNNSWKPYFVSSYNMGNIIVLQILQKADMHLQISYIIVLFI